MYDPIYYKMMTIVMCDVHSEYIEVQSVMWRKLNTVFVKEVVLIQISWQMVPKQNWNMVQILYGFDDPSKPMVDRKKTYYFH